MLKKVVAGALVVIILGTAGVTGHAASSRLSSYQYTRNITEGYVKIIQPTGDIIFENNVLISVQVFDNATVSLKIYKQDAVKADDVKIEEITVGDAVIKGAVVFGPDKVEQGENLKFYQKRIRLSPGKYAIVFDIRDKNGNKRDAAVKEFTVKNKEEEMNKTLNSIQNTNPLNLIYK